MVGRALREAEGYVPVPGGRVWYRIVGHGEGIPLLVLHGGPGYPHPYLESLEALSDERPVVFYDQLGCGRSDRPDNPSLWRIERFVEELVRVREALDLDPVHLFGHSWGSMLATDYVLAKPGGLASLVLASPFLSVPRALEDLARLRSALPPEVLEVLERHERSGTVDSREYRRAVREFYRRHMCRLDPWPDAMRRAQDGTNPFIYNTMWGPAEFLVTGNLLHYDRATRLSEIAVPTLFTCGRYDETPPETTAWYQSLLPGSEVTVFEQSSHMAHLEEPELFMQVVRDFLRRARLPVG